jgi:hypothetical protein
MINSTSLDQGIKLPEKYSHLSIKEYLQVLIDYAEKYRKWTDIHIVNFMTMNQKDLIDGDWWKVLNNANSNQEEWVDLIVNITNGSVKVCLLSTCHIHIDR